MLDVLVLSYSLISSSSGFLLSWTTVMYLVPHPCTSYTAAEQVSCSSNYSLAECLLLMLHFATATWRHENPNCGKAVYTSSCKL